jgi:hypothetical protein
MVFIYCRQKSIVPDASVFFIHQAAFSPKFLNKKSAKLRIE